MRESKVRFQSRILVGLGLALVATCAMAIDDPAAATLPAARPPVAVRPATPTSKVSPLEHRVELLARELDLNSAQRLRVKALLESQREQVQRVWNDETLPGAVRVKRTQTIGQATEDGIRALLTDVQKQKFTKPVPAGAGRSDKPDGLATYLDQVNRR